MAKIKLRDQLIKQEHITFATTTCGTLFIQSYTGKVEDAQIILKNKCAKYLRDWLNEHYKDDEGDTKEFDCE